MMMFLNGKFVAPEDAKISVLDRGFIFGDGVYEFIPIYNGRPLAFAQHLKRLANGLAELRITNPYNDSEWTARIGELMARNPHENQGVYIQVTRGVAKRDHAFPKDVAPTVFMMCNPLSLPTREQVEKGVACVSTTDLRWQRCHLKTTAILGNVLARQEAADENAVECVMLREGYLTEASASNVIAVKGGKLLCPPMDNLVLPGITYAIVMDLARANGIALDVRKVTEKEVRTADELWLTSSSKEVLAITTLDGKPVGSGVPGPLFKRMHALFQDYKATLPAIEKRAA